MKSRWGFLRAVVLILVRIYRSMISPWLGSNCRYYPSCSAYALVSFTFLPIHKAIYFTTKRVLSCSPYSSGGVDMPPGLPEKEVMDYLKKNG